MLTQIRLIGCCENTLQNLSLDIPKEHLIVVTGVSGSGKTSLVFDTLYAEGQQRFLDCLTPSLRRWIKKAPKPHVSIIEGLTPTLAISERMKRVSGLRTVGTYSEIYDYLSELYVRCGVQHSPITNKSLYNLSHEEMVEKLLNRFEEGSRLQICVKQRISDEQEAREHLLVWQQDGFVRFMINGEEWEEGVSLKDVSEIEVVIDRFVVKSGIRERVSDSLRTALDLGKGVVWIKEGREGKEHVLSEVYYCPETQQRFPKLTHSDFNFTLPQGACEGCQGRGGIETVDLDLLSKEDDFERLIEAFPRRTAEIYYKLWKASDQNWNTFFHGAKKKISLKLEIGGEQKKISSQWKGWVTYVHEELHTRGENSRFSGQPYVKWKRCTLCDGERLKKQTRFVYWREKNLPSLTQLSLSELLDELSTWEPTPLLKTLHEHIFSRLQIMQKVGLGYLSLDQEVTSLSTGELHRLQIATHITAKLSGMTYVFDEPMTGLHPQDRKHLISLFKELKDLSNTVIVVENDLETIQSADWVIELGPKAGKEGGQLIYEGKPKPLPKTPSISSYSKKFTTYLTIGPFSQNNLKDIQVQVPLNAFVGFCGVSGAGKSTLLLDAFAPHFRKMLKEGVQSGLGDISVVDTRYLSAIPRSTVSSYLKLTSPLRKLLSETKLGKARGIRSGYFSLNKKGGRCEACEGLGKVKLTMPLLPDMYTPCSICEGKRYNREALHIRWQGHSLATIEEMSVKEASILFKNHREIISKLLCLIELGLEYLTLGQSFDTLSQGEMQRLKLAAELVKTKRVPCLYIFDEPTMGLHYNEVSLLVGAFQKLVQEGHSVLALEHNIEFLRTCDYLFEMGPEGGNKGGEIIFQGTPKEFHTVTTPTSSFFINR